MSSCLVTAQAQTFVAVEDTSIHRFNAGQAADQGPTINASKWTTVYVRFDLSSLSSGSTVSSATLKLHRGAVSSGHAATATTGVFPITSYSWSESSGGSAPLGNFPLVPSDYGLGAGFLDSKLVDVGGDFEFDVTNFVGSSVGGQIDFAVRTNQDSWTPFSSRSSANPPELVITTADPGNPVATFTATPVSGDAPLTVTFTDTSTDEDGQIASTSWDFGDGSESDPNANTSHEYTQGGVYSSTLTVTDDEGSTDSTREDITVIPAGFAAGLTAQYFNYVPVTSNPDIA